MLKRLVVLLVLVTASGCAARDYFPSLLPLFYGDEAANDDGAPTLQPGEPATDRPVDRVQTSPEELPPPRVLGDIGLTLDQAIAQTLDADPKIHAAFETVNMARGDLLTSSLLPNPQLLVDGIFLPYQKLTPDRPGGPPQTDANVSWSIDWFLFGKRAAAMASAALGVEVSAADFADLVRQRVAATAAGFYDVMEAQALADLARVDLDNLKRVEGITKERVKLGGVGSIEADRIRLAVLDGQREVRSREKTLAATKSSLRALIGAVGPCPGFRVEGSLAVPQPMKPLAPEEALGQAVETRPDLISLRRQLVKAEADVHVEKTKACPAVTPAAALSRQYQKALGSPDASSFDVSLTLSLPMFDRNQGNIHKAQSTQAQVEYNLQAQLVALRAEIEQAADDFRVAAENIPSDAEQLKAAASVRDRTEAAYKQGGRTLLDVLDAERAYRDTYRTYITGQSSYWHSLHKLNAAIGKQVLR